MAANFHSVLSLMDSYTVVANKADYLLSQTWKKLQLVQRFPQECYYNFELSSTATQVHFEFDCIQNKF